METANSVNIKNQKSSCCIQWKSLVSFIKVEDRYGPESKLRRIFEELIKQFFGSYCPCCGKKLIKKRRAADEDK